MMTDVTSANRATKPLPPACLPRLIAAAGNPAAMHPDGSAVNPELLMSMLEGNPGQLEGLPQALQRAVRSKDVAGFQVGAAGSGGGGGGGCMTAGGGA